jgi:uncharacterized Zn finger protein
MEATTTATKTRKPYDPGQPGKIEPEGNGRYRVESFKHSGDFYLVDLNENSCSCPHTEKRNAADCKHRCAARQKAYEETRQKAERQSLDTLRSLLLFNADSPREEIKEALDYAIYHREQAARTIAEMVAL